MAVDKIIDFEQGKYSKLISISEKVKDTIIVVRDDNTKSDTNYIKMTINSYNLLKEHLFEETLEVLNKIYREHIKLNILGLGYPIYRLYCVKETSKHSNQLVCSIIGFNTTENRLGSYTQLSFVDSINFNQLHRATDGSIDEIILTRPTYIDCLDETIEVRLVNIERIMNISDSNLPLINYNVMSTPNKTLTLSNLNRINLDRFYDESENITGIEKIVILDTCDIDYIPLQLFVAIGTLKELVLNSKIHYMVKGLNLKTPIKRWLSTDKDGYYIDANAIRISNNNEWDFDMMPIPRKVRVTFIN